MQSRDGAYELGPLALGLSIGLQVMMTAFLRLGTVRGKPPGVRFSAYADPQALPEYDLSIFAAGLLLALASGVLAVFVWHRRVAEVGGEERAQMARRSALLLLALAAASGIAFGWMMCSNWIAPTRISGAVPPQAQWGWLECARMLVPAAMAAVCAAWDLRYGCGRALPSRVFRRGRIDAVGLVAFPIFIALVVVIPPARWTQIPGEILIVDRLHHVNFFALGPALAFAHGKAFGTEIYSQYGIGWPWLVSRLSALPIGSYGAFIGVGVVYASAYYTALFLSLSALLRRVIWASIAVLLAIEWQLFSGKYLDDPVWMTPSSTMLRHPVDIGFFAALALHLYSRRREWVLLAGALGALGIFFETETGIELLAVFGCYTLLRGAGAWRKREWSEVKARGIDLGAFCTAVAVALLPLLFYASRGALFTRAFFAGWLEPLVEYGSWGLGAIPVSSASDAGLALFAAMVAVYLAAIGHAVLQTLAGDPRDEDVLLATIAAYGLALLALFVNRSHPYNLFHAAVPFAVVSAMLAVRAGRVLERWLPRSSFAPVLCGGLVLLLLSDADFLRYPSLLASAFRGDAGPGLSYTDDPVDISGLPAWAGPELAVLKETAQAIGSAARGGRDVAVFDVDDTLFYYAAGVTPWTRYSSLFQMVLTQDALEDLLRELSDRPPDTVLMLNQVPFPELGFDYVWKPLHEAVRSRYEVSQAIGPYEIWTRRNAPARDERHGTH